jgi:hypothetical protein
MIRIHGEHLTQEEQKLLRRAVSFTMDKLVSRRARKNYSICVRITQLDKKRLKEGFIAECVYDEKDNWKKFEININRSLFTRAKAIIKRLKPVLMALMHELVHVKQYLKNEMGESANGDTKFKGKLFKAYTESDEDKYYDSPWEIEAYGRELGLYNRFKTMIKREEANGRAK